jgi:hypothetical protein
MMKMNNDRSVTMLKTSKKSPYLICKNVTFYSEKDEEAFFEWIKVLEGIDNCEKVGNEFHLYPAAADLHDHDLRDLIAFFYRYKIDMKQLKRFLTKHNTYWFGKRSAPWYKKIFGSKQRMVSKK